MKTLLCRVTTTKRVRCTRHEEKEKKWILFFGSSSSLTSHNGSIITRRKKKSIKKIHLFDLHNFGVIKFGKSYLVGFEQIERNSNSFAFTVATRASFLGFFGQKITRVTHWHEGSTFSRHFSIFSRCDF